MLNTFYMYTTSCKNKIIEMQLKTYGTKDVFRSTPE